MKQLVISVYDYPYSINSYEIENGVITNEEVLKEEDLDLLYDKDEKDLRYVALMGILKTKYDLIIMCEDGCCKIC